MRIVVTGAKGMLGTDLSARLREHHKVIDWDLPEVDIADSSSINELLAKEKPDIVVHCAAYTHVDGCERDPDLAYRVNAFGAWSVASACQSNGIPLAYISTDFVFDGEKGEPYDEFDLPNPLGSYGRSKYAGEVFVRQLVSRHYIIRTAWLFGIHGNSFVKTMLGEAEEGGPLTVVSDQVGCPTYTVDLSNAIATIIASPLLYGTYHVTNSGSCSWAEFTEEIVRQAGIEVQVIPISSTEWPSPTRRPKDSRLRHLALELQGCDNLRPWQEALADFIKLYNQKS